MDTHRVSIEMDDDDDDHYSWECDCGTAGSGSGGYLKAELHSDRHIGSDDTRIDTYLI
jgi:hypothetical protein